MKDGCELIRGAKNADTGERRNQNGSPTPSTEAPALGKRSWRQSRD